MEQKGRQAANCIFHASAAHERSYWADVRMDYLTLGSMFPGEFFPQETIYRAAGGRIRRLDRSGLFASTE